LWLLKPWSWPLYKLSASCWSTSRGRLLEPPERAFARMDQLCCLGDLRKTLYSSFGSVWISESSTETEAARISFRKNSGKRVQKFALELPSVDSFVRPSTS
jgi:hypothetical protein